MQIENTEVKISLTVREAQSLATILRRFNLSIACRERMDLHGIPGGMYDDCRHIENELRNLVHFNMDRAGK